MFASIIRLIRQWNQYNRSLNELSRLSDRELADIGISRCDIPRVSWNAAERCLLSPHRLSGGSGSWPGLAP